MYEFQEDADIQTYATRSEEFYVIGINYQKKFTDKDFKEMFSLLDNYDENKSLVEDIPEAFTLQLEYIMQKLLDNYDYNIEQKIYYVDNYENISKVQLKALEDTVKRKNQEWAEEVGLID